MNDNTCINVLVTENYTGDTSCAVVYLFLKELISDLLLYKSFVQT